MFTRGSTDNTTGWRFFPLTTARATADIKSVHGMLEVLNMTADCRFVLWYQESDEPEMFAGDGTTVDVNFTAATTDGYWASVGYIAVTFTKAYVRFGVTVTKTGVSYGIQTTSNSTVCVYSGNLDATTLWMYGIGKGSLLLNADGSEAIGVGPLGQTPNVLLSRPPPDDPQDNIAYITSNTLHALSGLRADAFAFVLDLDDDPDPLKSTGIPSKAIHTTLDGTANAKAVYKDPHVLKLNDGKGWLLLLARYHSAEGLDLGPGSTDVGPDGKAPEPTETTSSAAIVGFWCGVPAACELEYGGVSWLYIYYTAESTKYDDLSGLPFTAFVPGTHVKRIDTRNLPWGHSLGWAVEYGGSEASVREERWDSYTRDEEVAGEYLGKVNIWVAEGSRWSGGTDPAASGNRLIWDVYAELKDVDAVPAVFEGGVALYFSANKNDAIDPAGFHAWGLWRAVLGPATAGREHGVDFVVRPVTDNNLGGHYDLIVRSNVTDLGPPKFEDGSQMRLDPDPVRLPSGEWLVFTGSAGPGKDQPFFGYDRFDTTEINAERTFREAW